MSRTAEGVMCPAEDPEKIIQENTREPNTIMIRKDVSETRLTIREKNTSKVTTSMARALRFAKAA